MPMTKAGRHLRVTDEQTIALVRRVAQHYNDQTIAAILAKQKRRTATGLPFTRARVAILRAGHNIPVYQPPAQLDVGPGGDDAVVVTITEAEKIFAVSKESLYRWIRDSFITAEQITPGAPGASASTKPCATASSPSHQRAGSASTKPRKLSASPTNRVAQGPTRRTTSCSRQSADAAKRPAHPGQTEINPDYLTATERRKAQRQPASGGPRKTTLSLATTKSSVSEAGDGVGFVCAGVVEVGLFQ